MKKLKLRKKVLFPLIILIIIIALLIFFMVKLKDKSYSLEYDIGDYNISENYNQNESIYYYEIKTKDIKYNFISKSEYLEEKKLISNIKTYEKNDYTCLNITSSYIKVAPLCNKKNELIDYHLIPIDTFKNLENTEYITENGYNYKNYKLYTKNEDLLVWNYKGLNHIKKDKVEFIKIFSKDIYTVPLATKINNYIFIPDYEQEYNFNNAYIINLDNSKVEKWKLDDKISFESYIAGINENSIFLVDTKNKKEYELVPHKKKMRTIATEKDDGIIYHEGEITKVPMKKIIATSISFTYKNNYHFKLTDKKLYISLLDYDNKTRITDNKVSSIVNIENDTIYYLVGTTLYKYNLKYGEQKIMEYSEWEFNNKNQIFIY